MWQISSLHVYETLQRQCCMEPIREAAIFRDIVTSGRTNERRVRKNRFHEVDKMT
jgi:hypothetical protein